MNSQCRWQINFPLPLSKKDNERLVTVRPRLTLTHNRLKLWQQQQALSPTLCGLTLTFGVKSFLEVEQHVCKPPHFIDQLHDCSRDRHPPCPCCLTRADGAQRAALRRSAQTPRHLNPKEEGGKSGKLGSRAIPAIACQSSACFAAASQQQTKSQLQPSLNGSQRNVPWRLSDSKSFLTNWQLVLCAQCSQRMVKPLMFKDKNTSICWLYRTYTQGEI